MRSQSRGGTKVTWVVVHTAEGIRKASDLVAFFNRSTNSSCHAVADDKALLDNLVPYEKAAWTLRDGNNSSDNLELCGFAKWTREQWLTEHQGMLNFAAEWIRNRCQARGIPIRKLDPAGVRAGQSGVIGHVDYSKGTGDGDHYDPGPGFPWDIVIARAAQTLAAPAQEDEMAVIPYDYQPTGVTDDKGVVPERCHVYTLPVGSASSVTAKAWLSFKCAVGSAASVRLMAVASGDAAKRYLVDKTWTAVPHDATRPWIEAPDGADQFTAFVRCAYPYSLGIETRVK